MILRPVFVPDTMRQKKTRRSGINLGGIFHLSVYFFPSIALPATTTDSKVYITRFPALALLREMLLITSTLSFPDVLKLFICAVYRRNTLTEIIDLKTGF